ncbi:MAG TPA: Bax inhibitor-1/YccA family protein [Patescibacteria group bacterium]|nr:Bax inhibitor-1/YccA family protein [Patescibacteria group bacterium]
MGRFLPGFQSPVTNPIFRNFPPPDAAAEAPDSPWAQGKSFAGATNKGAVLILVSVATTIWVWLRARAFLDAGASTSELVFLAFLLLSTVAVGLVVFTVHRKRWAPLTALLYALVQGLLLGVIAAGSGMRFPGVGILAVLEVGAMPLGLLLAYRFGLVHASDSFNRKIGAAFGGPVLFFAANFVLGRLGKPAFSLWAGGVCGIVLWVVIACLAGICMTADFDAAARGASAHLSQSVEWYLALGLVLTQFWFVLDTIDVFGFWEISPQGPPGGTPGDPL